MKNFNYILGVGALVIIGVLAYLFWNVPEPVEEVVEIPVTSNPCDVQDCTQGK